MKREGKRKEDKPCIWTAARRQIGESSLVLSLSRLKSVKDVGRKRDNKKKKKGKKGKKGKNGQKITSFNKK
jgi:hypothetical protein